ncbi:MAG: YceI family protein, partial [Spongiibacteraceae bacterium]
AEYQIDTEGAHAFVQFRIKHLGYSWLQGSFDDFSGRFYYDRRAPETASVSVRINTASVNTKHAVRDGLLRGAEFLNTEMFPVATFTSNNYFTRDDGSAALRGDLSLNGVTRSIVIKVKHIGGGKDPWGGFRQGFQGRTEIALEDFGIMFDLGPEARTVELILNIEGVKVQPAPVVTNTAAN